MPSIVIQDTTPYDQYTNPGSQSVFNVSFQFLNASDLQVYYTASGAVPFDPDQILTLITNYTVSFNPDYTGSITLVSGSTYNSGADTINLNSGDIVTIVDAMSNQRLNYYINTAITANALNTDFESLVLMIKQNTLYNQSISPHYNLTANPQYPRDILLPILGPSQAYVMNSGGTEIEAVDFSSVGTVTSIGITQTGSFFTITGSPVTSSGNINLAITGTLGVAHGGTGQTTLTQYAVLLGNGTGGISTVSGLGTSGYVLTSNGGSAAPTWQSIVAGVGSVSGTAAQIDVSPTTGNVVVSIDAAYVGQTSITTLGTIATGTWAGTNIALAHGGTNAALTASNGGIFYSTASAGAILAGTATAHQLLLSGASTTPLWSTSTYPTTNAANTLLYASSANTMAALATANNGVLVTDGSGVPSIGSTLPAAVQGNITALGTIASGVWNGTAITVPYGGTGNTTFTAYSVICAGTTSTGTFQNVSGLGSSGQVLTSQGAGALPHWASASSGITTLEADDTTTATGSTVTISGGTTGLTTTAASATLDLTGTLIVANGGTGIATTTAYAVICGGTTSTGALQHVSGVGSSGQVLTSNGAGALPTWQAGGGGGTGITWNDQTTGTVTMAVNNGYVIDNGASLVTLTLPATAALGSLFIVAGKSAGGWIIDVASGQTIHVGSTASTASTGTVASSNQYDCITLVCVTANTTFVAYGIQGNLTVV